MPSLPAQKRKKRERGTKNKGGMKRREEEGGEEEDPGFTWGELADQRFLFMPVVPIIIGGVVVFCSTGCSFFHL